MSTAKRAADNVNSVSKRSKRVSERDDDNDDTDATATTPCSFVTWNCNGFLTRCKYNGAELERLVRETDEPDVILLQEVRCKAFSSRQRHAMCQEDDKVVSRHFLRKNSVFCNYIPHWSLADTRYAGTCTLIHKRVNFESNATNSAFSMSGATNLLLKKYNLTRQEVGIAEEDTKPERPSSSASEKKQQKKQTSIRSFFSPKKTPSAAASTNLQQQQQQEHDDQGRFQFFCFPDLDIIHTYVPNHGMKEESFARRKAWDEKLLQLVRHRQQILQRCNDIQRPLLWVGDLNVARDYRDGTHWNRRQGGAGGQDDDVYEEYWTDEAKCLVRPNPTVRDASLYGMPSFTPAERSRFETILEQGGFIDVWRVLHPNGSTTHNDRVECIWDRPDYTWRGALSKDASSKAKYQGKGQRLDYFLTSHIDMDRVESCEILGYGEMREGLFCASDHCATKLQLRRRHSSLNR